jgi:hypothetical protein
MALALFESGWLDLLGLYPALANGRPAQSVLTTVGGSGAIEETYRALNDVRSWWP